MTLIFNASPLIVLAKAGLLNPLMQLGDKVWIPQAVVNEILAARDPGDPASHWVATQSSLIHPPTPISPFVMAWDLGGGESAVIALTEVHPHAIAVLDDLAARRCAQAMGLRLVGTIGLVLMAKQAGIISSASCAFDAIVAAGLFISRNHLEMIRDQAGE